MNLFITGAWQEAHEFIPQIIEMGHEVQFSQFEKDDLPCDPEWVEGIIGNGIFVNHPIEKFIGLRYIQLTSAGFDRVPMDYVRNKRIKINNARGVYSIPMAEYAVTGILTLYKRFNEFLANQTCHKWEKKREIKELYGKQVCVIGCGSVGTECAKRFGAMDCTVFGVDPAVTEGNFFSTIYNTRELKEALKNADIVIVTLPLTDKTKGMINENLFNTMKSDSILVNIARGAIVDESSLIEWLKRGGSAVLDVFEEEPQPANSTLWDMPNVIITPHNSFIGEGNGKRLSDLIMANLKRIS